MFSWPLLRSCSSSGKCQPRTAPPPSGSNKLEQPKTEPRVAFWIWSSEHRDEKNSRRKYREGSSSHCTTPIK
ncbi:hypothetical protein RIF29_15823 [Crotalaria pallida]|uniref:Uncharacterized protein n=1 Tax=Crotalaria pallida TaxID=3830 RepID=A0AAN9FHT9_CROPI